MKVYDRNLYDNNNMVIGIRRIMNCYESLVCLLVMGLTLPLILYDGNKNGLMITAFMTPTYIRKNQLPTTYFPTRNIIIGSSSSSSSMYSTQTPKDEKSQKVNITKNKKKESNNKNPIKAKTSNNQKKESKEEKKMKKKVVEMSSSHTKIRRLKDRMWVREALEDITAAEFACTLDSLAMNDETNSSSSSSSSSS